MVIDKVRYFIDKEQLISSHKETILVALSGGADSVALLRILLKLGYSCIAAHCNFWLRDEESLRDEQFVTQLCKDLKVPLHKTHFDTFLYAEKNSISIEMAARELRYQWFYELKERINADSIAVAHHIDDNIETLLLNLIRGSGIKGLTGIPPRNQDIIRPLLCLYRKEIEDYLESIGQGFVTDSTNLETEYTRNKIRLKLLPLLQEINPSIKKTLNETIGYLRETEHIYLDSIKKGIQRVYEKNRIDIAKLLQEPSPSSLLYEILYPKGFTPQQIESICHALYEQPGKQFFSSNWKVLKDRDYLIIYEKEQNLVPPQLEFKEVSYNADFIIPKNKETACFDKDKLKGPLSIRKWQPGDYFIPFGMKGRKKISDYLTDEKFSRFDKEKVWLLCSGEDIAWIINERTDQRFKVDKDTKTVLIVREKNRSQTEPPSNPDRRPF